jgi:hypothetical protein
MAAKLTRLTHKIAIQRHPIAESCTIRSSRSRLPVWKLLDTPSYGNMFFVGPCHNSVERPRVADGGDGLQILRVAANIFNKKSRTADKGWSSILGVGRGASNSSPQKSYLLRNVTQGLGIGGLL